jgi:hypothetical protein
MGDAPVHPTAGIRASNKMARRLDPEPACMAPKRNCPIISRRIFIRIIQARFQFVFGVQDPNDSAIPVVRWLIARYPEVNIQLVLNAATHGSNRKVSNLINMAQVARHSVIVAADGDVAVGRNYLSTLAATLTQPGVGAITCLYRGLASGGFWSRLRWPRRYLGIKGNPCGSAGV